MIDRPSEPQDTLALGRETRAAIESIRDYAIFLLDPAGRIITWNAGARAIKGYQEKEIIGSHMSRFYPPEDVDAGKPARILHEAAENGRVEDEGWRVRKDGTRFWADVVITAVRDPAGSLTGFVKVTRDLTQQKQAQETLRQSVQRLRLLIDSVTDYAIFMLDPDGRVATWNPGAERIKGYKADEIVGRHFSALYPAEDVAGGKPEAELRQASKEGRLEDEGWRLRKDGTRFWASIVLSAIRNEKGELVGFTKVTRDMTARKKSQEDLERRAGEQLAVADIGLYALQNRDLQAVMDRAVETVRRVLGADLVAILEHVPTQEALSFQAGSGWNEGVVGDALLPAHRGSLFGQALAAPKGLVIDVGNENHALPALLREHGIQSGVSVAISSARDGEPYGVFAAYSTTPRQFPPEDITFLYAVAHVVASAIARQRGEEQLRQAEGRAREQQLRAVRAHEEVRERDEFLTVAAHELRTPLTVLQLKLEGMERALQREIDAAVVELMGTRLEGALRQAEKMTGLIERLLDVSRIVAGQFELDRRPVDLRELLDLLIEEFREEAREAKSMIVLSAKGDARGHWDRARLEQAVGNLVANAIKYGAGKPIELTLEGTPSDVVLTVRDHGIGISEEHRDRIFGPFERAAPSRHFRGLGIGLYITRHIIEAHGGTIQVSSEAGAGTTFAIELPKRPHPAGQLVGAREQASPA